MRQMVLRDNRVADVNILRNLLQGVSFFASTTLLILAGLLAILGASDRGIEIVRALPFAAATTLDQWELKLLVLGIIFVHAFFKFTWALRQFNYCSVLIGAAPKSADNAYAQRAAEVSTNASKDFNQGLRAYYFSLAALGWFIHPWVFVAGTTPHSRIRRSPVRRREAEGAGAHGSGCRRRSAVQGGRRADSGDGGRTH